MIDLRSDTVTLPTPAMREAIAAAPVGDDVYGEDPTVIQLQDRLASLLNKEAALYCPSGTQSNLLAILAQCERGDEYIVGQTAHSYKYEGGGAAVLGSIQPQPLDFTQPGVMPLERIRAAIKPADVHFAITRLVALENTQNGVCLPDGYTQQVRELCDEFGLALHLDGARLFNAVVASGQSAADLTRPFDSVSVCLSKGLGAPMGSVLVANQAVVDRARRWRKMLGGGMRQAGMMAAAGLYALDHHVERLAEDHANATRLAEGLGQIDGIEVGAHSGASNMVFIHLANGSKNPLPSAREAGIVLPAGEPMRLVLHHDVSSEDVTRVIDWFTAFMGRKAA